MQEWIPEWSFRRFFTGMKGVAAFFYEKAGSA